MKIAISEKRKPPKSVLLSENITLTSWGSIFVNFGKSHLFPSGFCIENRGTVIYIDPVLIEPKKAADYILITHTHPDHFSLTDIQNIINDNTIIICPKKAVEKLRGYSTRQIRPGETVELDGISCRAVPAYSVGFPSHPMRNQNVGYVLTIDGMNIYHAGDTDLVPEMRLLEKIDVALVPIDGGNLTMTTQEAASFINNLKPRMAIPMHYVVEMNKAGAFKGMIDEGIEVVVMAD